MTELPHVRPCDGNCGAWLPADAPPSAIRHGHLDQEFPVVLCEACRRKLPPGRIETKEHLPTPTSKRTEIPSGLQLKKPTRR